MGFAILALYYGGRANSSKTEDFPLKFQRFAKPGMQSGRLLPATAQRIQISIKSSPISSTKRKVIPKGMAFPFDKMVFWS